MPHVSQREQDTEKKKTQNPIFFSKKKFSKKIKNSGFASHFSLKMCWLNCVVVCLDCQQGLSDQREFYFEKKESLLEFCFNFNFLLVKQQRLGNRQFEEGHLIFVGSQGHHPSSYGAGVQSSIAVEEERERERERKAINKKYE